jgi:hypothetical protein
MLRVPVQFWRRLAYAEHRWTTIWLDARATLPPSG